MPQLRAAIALCERTQGATSRELAAVLHLAYSDVPWRLRYWLKRTYPKLVLSGKSIRYEPSRNAWHHGNEFVYRITEGGK
jgi:hypothetical protein